MKMLVSLQGMNESCNGPSLNDMDNVHFFFCFFFLTGMKSLLL